MQTVLSENTQYLAGIIHQLSALNTNPVLLCLENETDFVAGKKYSLPSYINNDFGLRIFYHHHDYPNKTDNEHGHFHLFIRLKGLTEWHHLLLISMDKQGQAFQLATVNQWVTDSRWIEQTDLGHLFQQLEVQDPESLLHSWFIAILSVFHEEIISLITKRDQQLSDINETFAPGDNLKNRDIYTLSSQTINLEQKLTV